MWHGVGALYFGQSALGGVPGVDVNHPAHLAELVTELACGIEGEMTRAAAGIDGCKWRIGRRKLSALGIEAKDQHFVHSQVRDDDIAIVWRNTDPMRVGPGLNGRINAAPNILDESCQFAQRKRVFAYGIKEAMIRRNGKKRRIDDLRSQLGLAESTGRGMEAADINSLAVTLSHAPRLAVMHVLEPGVSADVHEEVMVLSGGGRGSHKRENDNQTERVCNRSHEPPDLLTASKRS